LHILKFFWGFLLRAVFGKKEGAGRGRGETGVILFIAWCPHRPRKKREIEEKKKKRGEEKKTSRWDDHDQAQRHQKESREKKGGERGEVWARHVRSVRCPLPRLLEKRRKNRTTRLGLITFSRRKKKKIAGEEKKREKKGKAAGRLGLLNLGRVCPRGEKGKRCRGKRKRKGKGGGGKEGGELKTESPLILVFDDHGWTRKRQKKKKGGKKPVSGKEREKEGERKGRS